MYVIIINMQSRSILSHTTTKEVAAAAAAAAAAVCDFGVVIIARNPCRYTCCC